MNNHHKHDDVKARIVAAKGELEKLSKAFAAERKAAFIFTSNLDNGIAHCKTSLRFVDELLKLNDAPTDETDYEIKI